MEREELLQSKAYWIVQFQAKLFETVKNYMKENNLTQTEFAKQIGVNKSYVSQILNGNFDHKVSKYVDLMLACGKSSINKYCWFRRIYGQRYFQIKTC